MRHNRRLIALLLVLATLLTLFPATALASPTVKALKLNKWYPVQMAGPDDGWTAYRLKLTSETVVYVSWKDSHIYGSFSEVGFYTDRDCTYCEDTVYIGNTKSGKDAVVLYPGTYYVTMLDTLPGAKVLLSTGSAAKLKKGNYTLKKAIPLSASQKAEMVFDNANTKARWYKLSLDRKQSVRLYINQKFTGRLTLYNSKLKKIVLRQRGNFDYITAKKLAKGSYYLKVTGEVFNVGAYQSVYWK